MAGQVNFEVHTLKGSSWVIDSTYSKRDDAMEVAKELYAQKAFEGIKVIKDTINADGSASEIVIYDTSKAPKSKPAAPVKDEAPAAASKPRADVDFSGAGKKKAAKQSGSSWAVKATLIIGGLGLGGLVLLFALSEAGRYVSKLF